MDDRTIVSPKFSVILFAWLLVSFVVGLMLSFFVESAFFFDALYSNYKSYIKNYKLFCCIMGVAVFLWPFASLYIWKIGFEHIVFPKGINIKLLILFLSVFSVAALAIGLGQISLEGRSKMTSFYIMTIHYLDWAGAVIISFTGLYLFTTCVVVGIKGVK